MEFVLAERLQESKTSSWQTLQDDIEDANRFRKGVSLIIDRRKLQKIAEGRRDVRLSLHELELIDTYLTRDGSPGLAEFPLLRRQEDLFHTLRRADQVSFFVGVRSVDSLDAEMIARWDVGALNVMKDRISTSVQTQSFDVLTRDVPRPMDMKEWRVVRNQATGNVVVSIGSPVASASSEYLLAEMFDIPAYKARAALPPVCFAHPSEDPVSAFVRSPREVPGMRVDGGAVLVDGNAHVTRKRGADYGLVVGQRTGPENAAFVVAGNSGPGTLAAAECFADGQISMALPPYGGGGKQPVLVAIVATDIRADVTDRRIDKRTVGELRMMGRPAIFDQTSKGWIARGDE